MNVSPYKYLLLLQAHTFVVFFQQTALFARFGGSLNPFMRVFLLHHAVILKHTAIQHHVHVLLEKSGALPHICVGVQLLLHLLLFEF